MRRSLLSVLALLTSPCALACVIDVPDEAGLMRESSAIFEGVLIEEEIPRRETIPNTYFIVNQTFSVRVTRVWKGKLGDRVVVSKMDFVEQCVGSRRDFEYTPILFVPGQRVILYAKQEGQNSYSMLRLGYFFVGAGPQPSLLNKSYGTGTPR